MADGIPVVYMRSGMNGRAYLSRSQVWCDCCGRAIAVGTHFIRSNLAVSGTPQTVCGTCRPFRVIAVIDEPVTVSSVSESPVLYGDA